MNDKRINFEVDGKIFLINTKEMTILQSCINLGIFIPRFCYHEKLSIAGNCRMCLVEILNPLILKPVASCGYKLTDNMIFVTQSMIIKKAREGIIEFLLINHPLDCPICDQANECDLQDQTILYGSDRGRYYENRRSVLINIMIFLLKQ